MIREFLKKKRHKTTRVNNSKNALLKKFCNLLEYDYDKFHELVGVIAKEYNVLESNIMSERRFRQLVRPRHMLMFFSQRFINVQLTWVAEHIGGRNHATVHHGVESAEDNIYSDKFEMNKALNIGRTYFGEDKFNEMWEHYLEWRSKKVDYIRKNCCKECGRKIYKKRAA